MEPDEAVAQLLGVDTKLGILAGLALVAKKQQEQQSEDEDASASAAGTSGASSPNDKREGGNGRKAQRKRNGSAHPGATGTGGAENAGGASTPNKAKYSVHEQRDVIRKFQEQNQILKQELSIESRDARSMLSMEKRQQLSHLHKMAATFTKKIDLVKKSTTRVDELLVKKAQELEAIRQQQHSESNNSVSSSLGASSSSTPSLAVSEGSGAPAPATAAESSAASMRRVRALENRLELSLVKKNEMDSINKHLRAQIEKVRKDRVIFDGIYKKLEKEMSEYRQRHELSIEELRKAMDAKAQVNLEILRIQSQAEQEQRTYELQFQELKACIETSMREAARLSGGCAGVGSPLALGSPFSSKASNNSHLDCVDDTVSLASSGTSVGTFGNGRDNPLNRISVLSTWKIGYDRALASTNEGAIATYEKAFAGIKQLTGIKDIAKIAEEIVQRDEANFKRFKRVEELHQEEVALQAQTEELTAQIEAFKAQEGIATSATQKQQCRELESKSQRAVERAKAFDNEFEDTATTLTRIKSTVHSIHSMLAHANCARNVDKFSLGSAHLALGSHSARDVTDTNVLEYLQAIETFTTSLMKETHEAAAAASASEAVALGSNGGDAATLSDGSSSGSGALGVGGVLASHAFTSGGHHTVMNAVSSPIGHGPPTLPSDPSQKLRVHVPAPGGVNGVIVIPASSPFGDSSSGDKDATSEHNAGSQSPIKALQQQQHQQQQYQLHLHQGLQRRKSGGRFELMARKSLSQVQFAAALAAAVAAANNGQLPPSSHFPPHHLLDEHGGGGGADLNAAASAGAEDGEAAGATTSLLSRAKLEEEEEERALTYDELRQYAAKNVVKKKSDDTSLLPQRTGTSGSSSAAAAASNSSSSNVSPSKAAAHHSHSHHHHS